MESGWYGMVAIYIYICIEDSEILNIGNMVALCRFCVG